MNKFVKLFLPTVDKIVTKNKLDIPYENYIFANDCSRKDIWRTSQFNDYKIQREEIYKSKRPSDEIIFKTLSENLFDVQMEYYYYELNPMLNKRDNTMRCLSIIKEWIK